MIVGTAGHVDHGKTTLVRLLTGIDTDRLKEEKARGITTDLGFAYMPGPDGAVVGFIDVPGHESLVRTMVAGAAAIDFALLVVAADEGVKPQTREHVEILRLLGLERGVVALTKADRADAARRAAVLADVAGLLDTAAMSAATRVFVSATTGEGVEALKQTLLDAARQPSSSKSGGLFRLAIDRAFTLKGVGTVVAGTAVSGRIALDDVVTIMPGRIRSRVRSLHVQNRSAAEGAAGDRCALALVGVAREAAPRGAWVCGDADPFETMRIDVELHVSADEAKPVGPSRPVHFHCGASDVLARVSSLSSEALQPGASGFARIALSSPLPLRHGDRLVLRDASARRTIGGGRVVDTRPPTRRRRSPERLARLDAMADPDPATSLARLLAQPPEIEDVAAFAEDRGLTEDEADALLQRLDLEVVVGPDARFVATRAAWGRLTQAIERRLADLHATEPDLPGLAAERLRTSIVPLLPKPTFAAVAARLVSGGRLARRGHWLHLPDHVAQLSADDRRLADLMLPLIAKDRFRPPRVRDLGSLLAVPEPRMRQACKTLVRTGALIEVAHDHFFTRETVVEMAAIARNLTSDRPGGRFTAADFRDQLDNGRKVAIQILDFFDRHGLTHRVGDLRRVVKAPETVFGSGSSIGSTAGG